MRVLGIFFAATTLSLAVDSADASLLTDSVNGIGTLGSVTLFDTSATVVDPGREFSGTEFFGRFTGFADFTGDELTIGYEGTVPGGSQHTPAAAFVFSFSDLDWVGMSGAITGLTLLSASPGPTDAPVFGTTRWSVDPTSWIIGTTADSISINTVDGATLGNLGLPAGFQQVQATFRIDTRHTVPEPTTTALLALGLLGAGFARKRRTH